ncbi:MAG: phosphoenolpyruvate carboxylase [Ectothiorhodospiraceae bacterium]|nr:phosphoenolpyruvate carboxylase [Chromatiales bacterium]MCP5154906.1 phosphoenolpyruvate carboxylase [Ectothiorhodospiraceae bacterium]
MSDHPAEVPSLRDEVSALGHLLGEVLETLEGKGVFAHVELARQAARARRDGDPGADGRFRRLLRALSAEEGLAVTRAFSTYFGLVNLAERLDRLRHHGGPEAPDAPPPREGLAGVLGVLRERGVEPQTLARALDGLLFNPVLTAHPTEAVRRSLLIKEQRIADLLLHRLGATATPLGADRRTLEAIRDELGIAWQTDEHFDQPTVADEVEHVLFYLAEVVYAVVPAVHRALDDAIDVVYGAESGLRAPMRMLRFGSWVGGDMDGNPLVGAETIRATLERQRRVIVRKYRDEVRALFDHLSQSETRVAPTRELRERTETYRELLPGVDAEIPMRYREMPYRVFTWMIWARLGAMLGDEPGGYAVAAELVDDLECLLRSLEGHGGTGSGAVVALVQRVRTFGFHLASLDVRENSDVHLAAVAEALGRPDLAGLDSTARTALLQAVLAADAVPLPAAPRADGALGRMLDTMRAIRDGCARYGSDAVGLYIISMARGADDVLAVLLLARMAGLVDAAGAVDLDVAPLFETVDDLAVAPATLETMLRDPVYAAHVRARRARQFIMLGYSDSNKEAGLGAARWALHRAQVALIERVERVAPGTELTLFHGRGGSISRGGGETRNGILAEPPGALAGRLRVTEQGEIIGQKYGIPRIATQTMEVALGALLERRSLDRLEPPDDADWHAVAERFAAASRDAYAALVHDDPRFVAYFRAATPIDVIERLRIGSRPPARRPAGGIESMRAIPWVFAWTQSRHLLTGWYGVGSGLEAAAAEFGAESLVAMHRGWRFFAALLSDVEMVLAKADMGIAARYMELAEPADRVVFDTIAAEFERTREWVCRVCGLDRLLARNPVLERAIALRNPYVDPMSLVQVDFLRRWRESGRDDPELERVLVETVRGIARGMQNTG